VSQIKNIDIKIKKENFCETFIQKISERNENNSFQ